MKKVIMLVLMNILTFYNINLFAQNQNNIFTQMPIWGGEIDGSVLAKGSDGSTVIYAWNSLNLWISEDGGENWEKTKLADFAGSGPSAVVVSPSSPNIVLAWVEAWEIYEQQRGLYRSEDYGETWEKISDITNFIPVGTIDYKSEPIHFSLKDPNVVYLFGNSYHHYVTGDAEVILYKSTDAGKTWQKNILLNGSKEYLPLSISVTKYENNNNEIEEIIYIGIRKRNSPYNPYKLYRSTDGITWQDISFSYNGASVGAYRIKTSTTGYVAITDKSFIFISINKGQNFSLLQNNYLYSDNPPTFAFSPDGNILYIVIKEYIQNQNHYIPRIATSTFSSQWSQPTIISTGLLDGSIGLEARDILIDPSNPQNIYIADRFEYGFLKSTDGGVTWQPKNNGLAGAYINSGIKDSQGNLYIVTKSAIYKGTNSGANWNKLYSGFTSLERFKVSIDPQNNNKVFLLGFGEVYVGEIGQDGKINSWKDESGNVISTIKFPQLSGSDFYYPSTTDIVFGQNNNMYYGIHYFGKGGQDNYLMKYNTQTEQATSLNFNNYPIFSIAKDPTELSTLYVGVGEIKVTVTTNPWLNVSSGEIWKIELDSSGNNIISTQKTTFNGGVPFKIIFDDQNPNIIYVGAYTKTRVGSNWKYIKSYGELYMSEDKGVTWKRIGVLGNVEGTGGIDSLVDFLVKDGVIYAANKDETGFTNLYYSVNGGVSFSKYQANIGDIRCLISGSLYAGSATGLWRLNQPPQAISYQVSKPKAYAYPNPFNPNNGYVVLKYFVPQGKTARNLKISIYNLSGELVYEFSEKDTLAGGYAYYYAWDGKNKNGSVCAKGVYIAVFTSNLDVVRTKIVLVK